MGNKNSTVLIVENDENYRLTLKETLEAFGCRILEATGPLDVMAVIENHNPNLVIMDMRLVNDNDPHDTSGLKLMRELPHHIPVIILTAHQDGNIVRDAYETMPNVPRPWAYLFKGDGAEAIRARVLEALQAHRPTAKPWYKETTFIVLAVLTAILIIGGGLYVEFTHEGSNLLGIIVVGVLIEVFASLILRIFSRGD